MGHRQVFICLTLCLLPFLQLLSGCEGNISTNVPEPDTSNFLDKGLRVAPNEDASQDSNCTNPKVAGGACVP